VPPYDHAPTECSAPNNCFTGSRVNTIMVKTPNTVPKGMNMHSTPAMTRQNK
jgi:hypothetical protein